MTTINININDGEVEYEEAGPQEDWSQVYEFLATVYFDTFPETRGAFANPQDLILDALQHRVKVAKMRALMTHDITGIVSDDSEE